jgi:hypothetical protein
MHCKNYLIPRPIAYMIPYHEKVIVLIILLQLLSSPSIIEAINDQKKDM